MILYHMSHPFHAARQPRKLSQARSKVLELHVQNHPLTLVLYTVIRNPIECM
jgi:hypothetical protein